MYKTENIKCHFRLFYIGGKVVFIVQAYNTSITYCEYYTTRGFWARLTDARTRRPTRWIFYLVIWTQEILSGYLEILQNVSFCWKQKNENFYDRNTSSYIFNI